MTASNIELLLFRRPAREVLYYLIRYEVSSVEGPDAPASVSPLPLLPAFPLHARLSTFSNDILPPLRVNSVHAMPCSPTEHVLADSTVTSISPAKSINAHHITTIQ